MDNEFTIVDYNSGDKLDIKAHQNYDEETYSIAVKPPIEALPISNKEFVKYNITVPITNTQSTFLAIKNTSLDTSLRLITFNTINSSNSDTVILLKVIPTTEITSGDFTSYTNSTISQFSVNTVAPPIPDEGENIYGTLLKKESEFRVNLIKDDVIVRIPPEHTLIANAQAKSSSGDIGYFIRHVEEF